jgi:hypothetical protein
MSDHPLVVALSAFLDANKLETGLLLLPGNGELRLVGSGINVAELIGISRSLNGYINSILEPTPEGKLN